MDDDFRIYVDQLRNGQEKIIDENLSPDFLEVHEDDLNFKKNIRLEGKAYLAQQELILNWDVQAEALISCSICNEQVPIEIRIDNFYYAEPLSNIKSAIFDFKDLLRETILLEVPPFAECNDGKCPRRKEITKYLKEKTISESNDDQQDGYHPFADLKPEV